VARSLGDENFVSRESDLDQVLYHPRKMVCAPPVDKPDDEVNPELLRAVEARLPATGNADFQRKRPADWERLENRWLYEWPLAPGDRGGLDSLDLATELDGIPEFQGQVAPVYYSVTQQHVQPGEDPEAGLPVLGLPPYRQSSLSGPGGLGHGVRIAVIDTGIDDGAVNAAPLVHQQYNIQHDLDPLADPTAAAASGLLGPAAGHGTFIASLIHCIAPGADVHSYRVTDPLGAADEEVIAGGIRRALDDHVNIINLSIGGYPFAENPAWPTLRAFAALEAAIAAIPETVAIVAAAGNCGSSAKFYPAAFPHVVGVAALDDCSNRLWDHSNYGRWVQACTRGVNVGGLFVQGKENPEYDPDGAPETWANQVNFATWSGTSFAAPMVAAQIAVLAAEMNLQGDTRQAAKHLLAMSKDHPDPRHCGKRILVDLPGQT